MTAHTITNYMEVKLSPLQLQLQLPEMYLIAINYNYNVTGTHGRYLRSADLVYVQTHLRYLYGIKWISLHAWGPVFLKSIILVANLIPFCTGDENVCMSTVKCMECWNTQLLYALYCHISQYSEDSNTTIRKVLYANRIAKTAGMYSTWSRELEFKMAFVDAAVSLAEEGCMDKIFSDKMCTIDGRIQRSRPK